MTQPRPAEEAKLQQGQKVFALEHIVKAGSSARGCNVPVGPSCVSSSEACSACAVVGERPPGLHAWWVQASRGTVPAAKAVERCAPATPCTLRAPSFARPPHPPSPSHPVAVFLTSRRCRFEDDHARAALRARQREASRQRIHSGQRLPPRVEVACLGPHPDWRGEEPNAGLVHKHLGRRQWARAWAWASA